MPDARPLTPAQVDHYRELALYETTCVRMMLQGLIATLAERDRELAAKSEECERLKSPGRVLELYAENDRHTRELEAERVTYTDSDGTTWTRPTAWAYAATCSALNTKTRELAEARAALQNLAEYQAVEGRNEDGKPLVGLSYHGSDIWGPCYDPTYEPYELCMEFEKWIKEKVSAALAAGKGETG